MHVLNSVELPITSPAHSQDRRNLVSVDDGDEYLDLGRANPLAFIAPHGLELGQDREVPLRQYGILLLQPHQYRAVREQLHRTHRVIT